MKIGGWAEGVGIRAGEEVGVGAGAGAVLGDEGGGEGACPVFDAAGSGTVEGTGIIAEEDDTLAVPGFEDDDAEGSDADAVVDEDAL